MSNKIEQAKKLLTDDYVWSQEFNEIKPVLMMVLVKGGSTADLLAEILVRG
jgi:hypothetical protein